jgi:C-terminal processing protease CtpA/Prc
MAPHLSLQQQDTYTPNDRHIHGNGIEPDVKIEFEEIDKPNSILPDPYNKDNQIIAVVEHIKNKISKAK